MIGDKLERQAEAERQFGELAPIGSDAPKQGISNLVNKGRIFLDLVREKRLMNWQVLFWALTFCCRL